MSFSLSHSLINVNGVKRLIHSDHISDKNAFQNDAYRLLQLPPGGGVYPSMHWAGGCLSGGCLPSGSVSA